MYIEKTEFLYTTGTPDSPALAPISNPDMIPEESQIELAAYARNHLNYSETHEDGGWRLDEDGKLAPIWALIQDAPEWGYLIGKVEVSPEAYEAGKQALRSTIDSSMLNDQSNSIAERAALSDQGIEVWRTTNAVDCTFVLGRGDREGADWFRGPRVDGQLPPNAMTDEQYREFSHDFRKLVGNNEGFLAFTLAEFVHDLAKSAIFVERAGRAGIPITGRDHDTILHDVIADEDIRDALLPTFAKVKEFSPKAYNLAIEVLRVNTNYAQLLTGEAPAQIMDEILDIDPQVRGLFFFKHRLDIAGALGHRQHAGSLTMDRETYQDMVDLEWAITTDEIENDAVVRNNAYIRKRGLRLGVDIGALPVESQDEMYACVRLAMRRRVHEPDVFEKIVQDFGRAPDVVKSILTVLLNRNGADDKAILPGYSQAVLMGMAKDPQFAENHLVIFAMLLHEASLYARAKGPNDTGITTADLKDIATAINQKNIDLNSAIRFSVKASGDEKAMIYPELRKPAIETLEELSTFGGESLCDKRIMMVGMAGGADNLHAGALGHLLAQKYGATLAGIMTFRRPDQILRGGRAFGASATTVEANSTPQGSWSRGNVEKVLLDVLQTGNQPEVAISNANGHGKRLADLEAFQNLTNADVIIGVDPGGDSLSYQGDHSEDAAHLGTKQDHQVIAALKDLARSHGAPAHSAVIAPGVYSPEYSLPLMRQANSQKVPLRRRDRLSMVETYGRLGMLYREDAHYSTTAMLFHKAALGSLGLQTIDLPPALATSAQNPWRVFFYVTQAMGEIVITDIINHHAVTANPAR